MKISIVYGTRPELIKLAPLIIALKKEKWVELTIINTGQHKEMLVSLEKLFQVYPDISLNVMTDNQNVSQVVSKVIAQMDRLIDKNKPDLVFVQGDTATVLATAIACFYSKVKIAHVEAGLRSFDLQHPFPEEFNRRTVSLFADYNFAPTQTSANNLLKEGVNKNKILVTGNTVIDSLQIIKRKLKPRKNDKKTILVTAHRRENHKKGIENICSAIIELLQQNNKVEFIWPIHPNPNVKEIVEKRLSNVPGVTLCAPMDYLELLDTISNSFLIWTDSGGIQEEVPSFGKPVLILREVTERPEVVSSGFGLLVGTSKSKIVSSTIELLTNSEKYTKMISGKNPFGDGNASKRIIEHLSAEYSKKI